MSSHPVVNTAGPSQLSIPQVVPSSIVGKKRSQQLITNPEVAADVAHTLKKLCLERKCWKWTALEEQTKNTVIMHVPHAIVKNALKRIADMGLMNHAKIKVEDSIQQ